MCLANIFFKISTPVQYCEFNALTIGLNTALNKWTQIDNRHINKTDKSNANIFLNFTFK